MKVLFMSDPHIGHTNIANFRVNVTSEGHNREWLAHHLSEALSKRSMLWVLGDAAFTEDALEWWSQFPGKKILVRGNHDTLPINKYCEVFEEVYGLVRYKQYWLSHAPVHPDELRGKINLHGHVHYQSIKTPAGFIDNRYFNCCVENLTYLFGRPYVSLEDLRYHLDSRPPYARGPLLDQRGVPIA